VPVILATSRGVIVVAVSGATAPTSSILLRAFLPTCKPDQAFGQGGSETIDVRINGESIPDITISSAAPGPAGSFILAGSSEDGRAVVGLVDADGRMTHGFGSHGWASLPWQGQPTALLREPSGEMVFGIADGADCCETEFLGATSPSGTVLTSFGIAGRAQLSEYSTGPEGAQISQIVRASNGDLLVVSSGGHMGVMASALSEFTANGSSVAAFDRNVETARRPMTFVGGVVVRPGGFVFVGAGQAGLIGRSPEPSASGQLLSFDNEGSLVRSIDGTRASKFKSSPDWYEWAFPRPDGGYLLVSASTPYLSQVSTPQRVEVVALASTGSVDRSYGDAGYGSFVLPSSSNPDFAFAGAAISFGHTVAIAWYNALDATTFGLTEVNR
jgi:hypothetical protein